MSQTPGQYADRLMGIMNEFVRTAAEAAVSVVPEEHRRQVADAVHSGADRAREQAATVIGEVGAALNRLSANVKPGPAPRKTTRRPAAKKSTAKKTGKRKAKKKSRR